MTSIVHRTCTSECIHILHVRGKRDIRYILESILRLSTLFLSS